MIKIGILSALGREIKEVINNIDITNSLEIKGYRFTEGHYNGLKIVVGTTSVGKVNAALCTEILINNFNPTTIINTGIAGSLSPKVKVLDIVISNSINFYDIDDYILKGCFPFKETFPIDLNLIEIAEKISLSEAEKAKVHFGKIISGDSFIASQIEKDKLVSLYNPLCVEMEGAAIAHVCYINKIPFISFRGISDPADDSARKFYKENEKLAANRTGKIVVKFLDAYNY